MKIRTDLKAGDAASAVNSFFKTAAEQASGLAQSVENTLVDLKQGFSDLLGLS
jgi:hypothetical protein